MLLDTAYEIATSNIRFGPGTTKEIGMDLKDRGLQRVMVLTDPNLREQTPVQTALAAIAEAGVEYALFDQVRVEPTDASFKAAIAFAQQGFDGFVAIGGGSVMDTAKAANVYTTYPADFLTYVNAPIGRGEPVPGPLKPLIAVPTTAGTGSETTGVAIFDFVEMKAKTGMAHRYMRPTLGIVDPDNTRSMPPQVAASTGLDVLSHALESYTALPFDQRPRPDRPQLRPAYQGSNPISDLWALEALRLVEQFLPRAVADPSDDEARSAMCLAAALAGIGFGNAGVHLPHGMSYPVAGMVESYVPEGYAIHYPLVPHGFAVIVNSPAVFRFTAPTCPQRHLRAAEVLGADCSGAQDEDAGAVLADRIVSLMRQLNAPNGLSALGYGSQHIPALVEGTLPQHRVTKLSPRAANAEELAGIFEDALSYW
ncbi:MAG: iron-containing alcohol dehydrogenase [Gemmatimonadetes bacterium]|nr:iron-containing alcohol dehydrogenase [Gemmatimonadota bacterium]MYC69657.1 iron-containing alcohol dehydrogenase [Gemmatimonadota bacterium]MYI63029.1 iron-containing alcohol dehydrogenase [Gemmatimonadota bacterium]